MFWLLRLLIACGGSDKNLCGDLCDELVLQCGYEAFPTYDSCIQGCTYDAQQGVDIDAELACVDAANGPDGCDTFAILECQHAD